MQGNSLAERARAALFGLRRDGYCTALEERMSYETRCHAKVGFPLSRLTSATYTVRVHGCQHAPNVTSHSFTVHWQPLPRPANQHSFSLVPRIPD
jgi:hypothetical protein